MRLPGANYGRGQSSLGREGDGAAASYEVASRTNLETMKSRDRVYGEINRLGEAYLGWEEATQDANASKALAKYHATMTEAETVISSTEAFKAGEIPTDVKFNRYKKAADGTEEEIDMVPAWQVAPQLYDYYEKQAADVALSNVSGKAKEKLALQLSGRRTDAGSRMMKSYFKGRMDDLRSTTAEALTAFVNAEDKHGAVDTIETAVKNGVFSVNEGRVEMQKVLSGIEVVQIDRFIGSTTDTNELDKFATKIGKEGYNAAYPNLSPAQRVNAMQAAESRSLAISAKNLAQMNHNRTMAGNQATNNALILSAQSGQPVPMDYIVSHAGVLTPSQTKAMLATHGAALKSDQATYTHLANTIGNSFVDLAGGMDVEATGAMFIEGIQEKVAERKLSTEDGNKLTGMVEAYTKGPLSTEQYKDGENTLKTLIVTTGTANKRAAQSQSDVFAVAREDMRKWQITNPTGSADRWVRDNAPKYKAMTKDKVVVKLSGMSMPVEFNKDGSINVTATEARYKKMAMDKTITTDLLKQAINALKD